MPPDDQAALLAAVVVAALYLAPGVLTGLGQWRRTRRVGSAVVATSFWPAAWVVWYARERFGSAASTRGTADEGVQCRSRRI
jgi:hypothetical protein